MSVLPDVFCWTRFGTEAGQTIESILSRKEQERIVNGGVFYWGIGNAIAPSLRRLLEVSANPTVLFSPIHSAPRKADVSPALVVAWTGAQGLDGSYHQMPQTCLVTSSSRPEAPRTTHYALVCKSEVGLKEMGQLGTVDFGNLTNLLTGNYVGSSQTTAVVRRNADALRRGRQYVVAMKAALTPPYFVRLTCPIPLDDGAASDWEARVGSTWSDKYRDAHPGMQRLPWGKPVTNHGKFLSRQSDGNLRHKRGG